MEMFRGLLQAPRDTRFMMEHPHAMKKLDQWTKLIFAQLDVK
jgi:hypothetical protein